jgi:hypothetical protein
MKFLLCVWVFCMTTDAVRAEIIAPDVQPLRAFIILTRFALNIGPVGAPPIRYIDPANAVQEGHEQASMSEFADYIKMDDEPCSYDKRAFVGVTADNKFDSSPQPYRYVIWHTKIDFSKMSTEWQARGAFLTLKGELGAFCKYETKFTPGATLNEARSGASRKAPTAGALIRCGHNLEGVGGSGGYSLQVLKALSYIHSHVCPPAELPF